MKVVIFDMDGTIIDSSKAIEKTINEIRSDMGLEPLETQFIVKAINEPGRNLSLDFYNTNNPSAKFRDNFEEKFRINYAKYVVVYNEINWLLSECKACNYAVALASNAPQNTLEAILKKCEIFQYFDEIIGADDKIPQKPDPKMLHIVCENLNASKAIFVGDSLKDELAAKNAKIPYLQVSWGFGEFSKSADFNADSVKEALKIIKESI